MQHRISWMALGVSVLLLGLLSTSSWAATYYARAQGGGGSCTTDRTNGSTLSTGVSCAGAGDTLLLRGGTYNLSGGFPSTHSGTGEGNRVTIAGDPGDGNRAVVINMSVGNSANAVDFNGHAYVTLRNLVFDAQGGAGAIVKIQGTSEHITLDNVEIRNGFGQGILSNTGEFRGSDDVGGQLLLNVEVWHTGYGSRQFNHGIYINSWHSIVDGARVHDNAGCGIHVHASSNSGNDITVRNSQVWNHNGSFGNPNDGAQYICGAGLIHDATVSNVLFYNNVSYNNINGHYMYSISGLQVYNNTLVGNSTACFNQDNFNGVGTFRNNICYNNGDNSIPGGAGDNIPGSPNPQFATCSNGDPYCLSSSSPAINRGTPFNNIFDRDKAGVVRGAQWDSGAYEFTTGGGDAAPQITITSPTSNSTYTTPTTPIALSGTAQDDIGLAGLKWCCSGCGAGAPVCPTTAAISCPTCSATQTSLVNWSIPTVNLNNSQTITVTATDSINQTTSDSLAVTLSAPSVNPLAYWPFNTNANDTIGGHNGTFQQGASIGPAKVGAGALLLDGDNDYVSLPDSIITDFTAPHTVCMWAYTRAPGSLGSGNLKQTLLNWGTADDVGLRWSIVENLTPPGLLNVNVYTGSGARTSSQTTTAVFAANTWVHICDTYNGSAITIWVNGGSIAQATNFDFFDPTTPSTLGAKTATSGALSGSMDEVKMWNRVLTASEIATEANTGVVAAKRMIRHRSQPK